MMTKRTLLRVFSAVLSFALFFTLLPQPVLAVSAADFTAEDAIAWCESQVGETLNPDNNRYKGECVDLILAYYDYLTGGHYGWSEDGRRTLISGNANAYASNAMCKGFTRIQGGTPQKGDILIYVNSGTGHVCIYEDETTAYHSSYKGVKKVQRIPNVHYRAKDYWGLIRPNFKTSTAEQPTPDSAPAQTFSDVPSTHCAYSHIESACAKGLMSGVGGGNFNPDGLLTNAELMQILYQEYGNRIAATPNARDVFCVLTHDGSKVTYLGKEAVDGQFRPLYYINSKDLSPNGYAAAVDWAVKSGVLETYLSPIYDYLTEYRVVSASPICAPEAYATRIALCYGLNQIADKLGINLPAVNVKANYSDYCPEIAFRLQQAGIVSGFQDGTFRAQDCLTRAQAAVAIDIFTDIEKGLKISPATAEAKEHIYPRDGGWYGEVWKEMCLARDVFAEKAKQHGFTTGNITNIWYNTYSVIPETGGTVTPYMAHAELTFTSENHRIEVVFWSEAMEYETRWNSSLTEKTSRYKAPWDDKITIMADYAMGSVTVYERGRKIADIACFGNVGVLYDQLAKCSAASEALYPQVEPENTGIPVGGFTDVKETDYFAPAVKWAVENGITVGAGDGRFMPDAKCTVAQMLTFLWRVNGSPASAYPCCFDNVDESSPYYPALCWASEKGLMMVTSSADGICSRETAISNMWEANGHPASTAKPVFSDIPSAGGIYNAVAWAMEHGITSGTSATTFSPNANCTRGQIVTFLYRYYGQ